jgi:hypothetical protein
MMPEIFTPSKVGAKDPYLLEVTFSNGLQKRVNVESLLWGPVYAPIRDSEECKRAFLDEVLGTVAWPSGADLAPEALYTLPEVELTE